jgi:uncharacterized protein (DUF1501 family)
VRLQARSHGWPGLATSALYEGRDLRATTDLRSILKGVLATHVGAAESGLEEEVFPGGREARPLERLVKV